MRMIRLKCSYLLDTRRVCEKLLGLLMDHFWFVFLVWWKCSREIAGTDLSHSFDINRLRVDRMGRSEFGK